MDPNANELREQLSIELVDPKDPLYYELRLTYHKWYGALPEDDALASNPEILKERKLKVRERLTEVRERLERERRDKQAKEDALAAARKDRADAQEAQIKDELKRSYMMTPGATDERFEKDYPRLREQQTDRQMAENERAKRTLRPRM